MLDIQKLSKVVLKVKDIIKYKFRTWQSAYDYMEDIMEDNL